MGIMSLTARCTRVAVYVNGEALAAIVETELAMIGTRNATSAMIFLHSSVMPAALIESSTPWMYALHVPNRARSRPSVSEHSDFHSLAKVGITAVPSGAGAIEPSQAANPAVQVVASKHAMSGFFISSTLPIYEFTAQLQQFATTFRDQFVRIVSFVRVSALENP